MPRIHSTYENFEGADYQHGVDQSSSDQDGFVNRKTGVPVAFQVTSPFDYRQVLLPHALVMHVSPSTLDETLTKKIERIQTRGGFVEQHWGDELGEMSISTSTGSFMNFQTGLSSVLRDRTIAYDRYLDLKDIFDNNGSVYDPFGNIVLQGKIMLMYDRGTYLGYFRSFKVEETDQSPFAFQLSLTFKVEKTILQIPTSPKGLNASAPSFQSQNTQRSTPFQQSSQGNLFSQVGNAVDLKNRADQYQKAADQDLLDPFKKVTEQSLIIQGQAVQAQEEATTARNKIGLPIQSQPVSPGKTGG